MHLNFLTRKECEKWKSKKKNKRFALYDDGKEIGEITWQEAPDDVLVVDHTFVDSAYRGQKLAQKVTECGGRKSAPRRSKNHASLFIRCQRVQRKIRI